MQRIARAVWPVFAWMAVVFIASTEVGSGANSSRLLVPILRWINPQITPHAIEVAQFIVRKCGHVTEYAVLSVLILRALRKSRPVPIPHWSWRMALFALGASAGYGATDEIHQIFVPTRGPSVHDVLIDTFGAVVGLTLAYLWKRRDTTDYRSPAARP